MTGTKTLSGIKCRHCELPFIPKNKLVKVCDKCKSKATSLTPKAIPPAPIVEETGLTETYKIQICKMLACFTPIIKIQGYFQKEHDLHVVYQTIKFIENGKKWEPIISRFRRDWIDSIYVVPVANRRYRLEAYDEIYKDSMESKKYSVAMKALEGARDETDEKKIGSTSYTLNYIATMSDEELQKKKWEIINRIKRMPRFRNEEPIELEAENAVDKIVE